MSTRNSLLSFPVNARAHPLLSNVCRLCFAFWVFRALFTATDVLRSSAKKRELSLLKGESHLVLRRRTTQRETVNANELINLCGELLKLLLHDKNLPEDQWKIVLPEALHAVRSLRSASQLINRHMNVCFGFPEERWLERHFLVASMQARNQLGTPGGAKSFLRGSQIFWTMSNNFKRCPMNFSREGENFSRGSFAPPGYGPASMPSNCSVAVLRAKERWSTYWSSWTSGSELFLSSIVRFSDERERSASTSDLAPLPESPVGLCCPPRGILTMCVAISLNYGAPFVKILFLTDLAQKLLSLRIFSYLCAEIYAD